MAGEVRFLRRTPVQHLSILLGWVQSTQPNRIDKCCALVLLRNLTSPAISILVKCPFWSKNFRSNVLFDQKIFGQLSFLVKIFLVKCPFWSKNFWSNVLFGQKTFGQMSFLVKKFLVKCPFMSKNFLSNDFWSNASLVK